MEQTQQRQIEHQSQSLNFASLPVWPTSRPGPKITEPPAGQKRVRVRTEQVIELNYDAEQGKSGERAEAE